MQTDFEYILLGGDTVKFADRELQLVNDCNNCDALEFTYFFDAEGPEQKFKENTYILHVFQDSVFGEWIVTAGPEFSNGYTYHNYFSLEGNVVKETKEYFIRGSISNYYSNIEHTGTFTIHPLQ